MFTEPMTDNKHVTQNFPEAPYTWTQIEATSGQLCKTRQNMKSSVKLLLFLMLIEVSSNESSTNIYKILNKDTRCSNNSTCPTWFTCNAKKKCQCNDGQRDRILCDDQAQISAVSNCNCVTYDKEKSLPMLEVVSATV